jgi:hypothetical protein
LFPTEGQIIHALLTRAPLGIATSLDLHVLGAPQAFVLSQNQTLQLKTREFSKTISVKTL